MRNLANLIGMFRYLHYLLSILSSREKLKFSQKYLLGLVFYDIVFTLPQIKYPSSEGCLNSNISHFNHQFGHIEIH